jgi:type I restriction enzyme S subunit
MIRTTNVRGGFIDTESVKYVSEETYRRWTRRLVPKRGDIIITREAPLGDVGKVRGDDLIFLGQRLYHFRPDLKKLDADFLLYSLLGPDLQSQIRSFGSGSTVEHMRLGDIPQLEIEVPSIEVQRRIGGILSAYDDLIENNLRRIKILEEMARALYSEWFVEFKFPGQAKIPRVSSAIGPIPKGWTVRKLGEILQLKYGKALKSEERTDGSVPVFGSSGIVGHHGLSMVQGPGIIVGRKGNVGSVFWSPDDFYPIDTVYFVTSSLPLRFLFHDLETKNFINNDAAVPGLNRNQAYSLETIVPSTDMLERFCRFADEFDQQASMMRKQTENLRQTRDLLLPRLLAGQVLIGEAALSA